MAQIKSGRKVLVHAGAGGLGSTVIQLAKHLGAYVATTANGKDAEKMRALGADLVIDYTKKNFAELLSGHDVVLDSLGGDNLIKSLTVLKSDGLSMSVVGPPDSAFAVQIGRPLLKPVMALLSLKGLARFAGAVERGGRMSALAVSRQSRYNPKRPERPCVEPPFSAQQRRRTANVRLRTRCASCLESYISFTSDVRKVTRKRPDTAHPYPRIQSHLAEAMHSIRPQ